jgi:hypothetical protein
VNAPLFLIVAPLAAALLAQLLRRWPVAAALSGAALLLVIRILLTNLGLDGAGGGMIEGARWEILGRALVLEEGTRQALILLYDGVLILLLLSVTTRQTARFTLASLVLPAPLAAALMAEPFIYGAAALVVAAGVLVALIQAQAGSTQGALRYLILSTLALPFLLVAGWMIESEQALFATAIGRLLLVATVILMAGFPFQVWVNPLIRSTSPYVAALLFGLVQLLIAIFLLEILQVNSAAVAQAGFDVVIRWSGVATAALGGLWLLRVREPEPLLGGLVLVDTGVLLLAFGTPAGAQAILTLLYLRFISLTLAGMGVATLRIQPGAPVGHLLLIYGALSLIGLPFTPGFSGRVLALSPVLSAGAESGVNPLFGLIPLLGGGIGLLGAARVVRALPAPRWHIAELGAWLGRLTGRMPPAHSPNEPRWRDPATWRQIGGAAVLLGGFVVAFVPSIVLEPLSQIATFISS